MRYKIYAQNGVEVNTIVAGEDFCKTYCQANGYTYELMLEDAVSEPAEPTEEKLTAEYEALVVSKIRERYSADDEYKVLREALAYPEDVDKQAAFVAYNEYVESCKAASYAEVYGDEQ